MPDNIYYQAADDILSSLGISPTPINVNLLVAWAQQEYTAAELAVTNNPLATSLHSIGALGYCMLPNGERSSEPCYNTLANGAAACAKTITNGLYPHLLAGLQNSSTATFFSTSGMSELRVWSSSTTYASRLQSTYNNIPAPPSWSVQITAASGQTYYPSPPSPSQWLLWFGGGLVGIGLLVLGIDLYKGRKQNSGLAFARRREQHDTDARINPDYLRYTAPTEQDVSEVSQAMDPCQVYLNVEQALGKRGIPVIHNRNLDPYVEAQYMPDINRILESAAITQQAEKCGPYATQILLHEGAHALLQNPSCMPRFRGGVTYVSAGHAIEEQEAELSSLVAMIDLGLPVELYDGTIIPPGRRLVEMDNLQRELDPDTFENIKWASNWLVLAAQGADGDLPNQTCPMMRKV